MKKKYIVIAEPYSGKVDPENPRILVSEKVVFLLTIVYSNLGNTPNLFDSARNYAKAMLESSCIPMDKSFTIVVESS